MTGSRRTSVVALVIWWVSILVLLPTGRPIVDLLRAEGVLALSVTLGVGAVSAFVLVGGWRLYRRGSLSSAQWRAALGLAAVVVLASQLLPRYEERWHCVQYSILGALLWSVLVGCRARVLWAVLLTALLGWLDEGIQLLLPDRVYDWWDVMLNAASGVAGVAIGEIVQRVGVPAARRQET